MDKGWGATLDNSDHQVFGHKPSAFGFDLSPRFNHRNEGLIMFPVNLNGRDENNNASPRGGGERREVLGEVDFFSDRKRPQSNEVNASIKNESSHAGDEFNVNTGLQLVTVNTGSDHSTVEDGISADAEEKRAKNELAQLHVELERMNAENMRLRGMLGQVSNNYTALQMHLVTLMQQQQNSINENNTLKQEMVLKSEEMKHESGGAGSPAPRQFLDLGNGATVRAPSKSNSSSGERTISGSPHNTLEGSRNKRVGREESPESEGWGPSKVPKTNAPTPKPVEQSNDATMRKVRVSVRARSEAPMISDGCQWRKYGQKMAKGNPCPRAYYRCTMAVACPVRKQVQRCAEDRAILITTYEGTHNHPLPPAAMAMASTTSAAANMLLSGSMPSADGMMNPNFLARTILPCSSNMATISASAPFPTVTLDLTQNPNPLQFQRPPAPFQIPFPVPPQNFAPIPNNSNMPPQVFGQALYNQSKFSGLQMSNDMNEPGQMSQVHPPMNQPHPSFSADTLSAATAAITADPNFTAALAAAISSIMGGGSQPNNNSSNSPPSNTNVNTSNINRTSSFQGN